MFIYTGSYPQILITRLRSLAKTQANLSNHCSTIFSEFPQKIPHVIGQPLPVSAPTFADNAQVSSWALKPWGKCRKARPMGGVGNNNFSPSGDYTREQSIITILRFFDVLD